MTEQAAVEYEAHILREAGKLCEEKWPRQVEEENMIAESLDEGGEEQIHEQPEGQDQDKGKGFAFPIRTKQ